MDIELLAGTKLGNYHIESLLGRGGMGVVYRAQQISLSRPVALKILPPTLSSDSSFVKRFHREAHAVAKLHHPNIVQVYDIGEEQGLHFFSMEYMEGQTLDKILKEEGRLAVNEAVRIVSQAARGIDHAHKNAIIHRDIKPSNIILDSFENVKVMDFGLARMTDDHSKLTQSGTLMGTLDYMSPEQCRGEELDEPTDIYSLGVVLYEILTGRVPFEAPNEAALIHKIISENPERISSLGPPIPALLEQTIHKMLQKNPRDRFGKMEDLIADLRSAESGAEVLAEGSSPSIAVLPFVNMSADPDQEYFCDGLSEELINALTQLEDLHVIARTSAFSFKGRNVNVREIGRELDVQTVLEGSVRKAGNRLRITAQLVDTIRGRHLWSERFDKEMNDVFAIQDEITLMIIDRLKPRLLGGDKEKLARRQNVNLEAYNLYLKGRWHMSRGGGRQENFEKAIECFEQAIEKEPDYAPAYAGLADCYIALPIIGPVAPEKTCPKARKAALKALQLDDTLAEAHRSLAGVRTIYDWDWNGAEREYRRAIKLSPGCTQGHQSYALMLMHMGRHDEAINEIERALELDPLSLPINRDAGIVFCMANKPDRAINVLQRILDMYPDFGGAHFLLGWAHWLKSRDEEAMAEFQIEMDSASGLDPLAKTWIGIVCGLTGKTDEARTIREDLLEQRKREYVPPFLLAYLCFALGEIDRGFEWLDRAYEEHDAYLCYLKHSVSTVLNLHSDPRYHAMLEKIGLDK